MNAQARNIFAQFFNNQPNVMTPTRLGYFMRAAGNLAVELSTGEGIGGGSIYAVTVLNAKNPHDRKARQLSKLCDSRDDASAYIKSLTIDFWRNLTTEVE